MLAALLRLGFSKKYAKAARPSSRSDVPHYPSVVSNDQKEVTITKPSSNDAPHGQVWCQMSKGT